MYVCIHIYIHTHTHTFVKSQKNSVKHGSPYEKLKYMYQNAHNND